MAMGTLVEIEASGVSADAIADAFVRIDAFEAAFSFYRPDSLLARLNRALPGDEFALEAWQSLVLQGAMAFEQASGLAFNANLGADLIALGMRPALFDVAGVVAGGASDALRWLAPDQLRIERRVCLDLGGYAKGAAVDAALAVLGAAGAKSACVNAGGDLAVIGEHAVGVRALADWRRPARAVTLRDQAIATSARYALNGPFHGRRGLAVLGRDRVDVASQPRGVSVIAPRCAVADALTKVALVDRERAESLLAAHTAELIELEQE
ncbi:FAD:protein FMN transferase [Niveibacterium umoris]